MLKHTSQDQGMVFVSILDESGANNPAPFPRLTCFRRSGRPLIKYSVTEPNHKVLTADVPNSAAQGQAQMEPHSRPAPRRAVLHQGKLGATYRVEAGTNQESQ